MNQFEEVVEMKRKIQEAHFKGLANQKQPRLHVKVVYSDRGHVHARNIVKIEFSQASQV